MRESSAPLPHPRPYRFIAPAGSPARQRDISIKTEICFSVWIRGKGSGAYRGGPPGGMDGTDSDSVRLRNRDPENI